MFLCSLFVAISTREEALMLAKPFIYNHDEDVMVENYQNFIEILRSVNLDELSQVKEKSNCEVR